MRIFLTRHPKCILNELGRWQGQADSPPSARGRQQIIAFAEYVQDLGINCVIAGPKPRHQVLGQAIVDMSDNKIAFVIEPLLDEMNLGDWECLSRAECAKGWPNEWAIFENLQDVLREDFIFPNGESYKQARQRIQTFLKKLSAYQEIYNDGAILIISSTLVIKVMLGMVGSTVPQRIPQCSITELETSDFQTWGIIRLIDNRFLPEICRT